MSYISTLWISCKRRKWLLSNKSNEQRFLLLNVSFDYNFQTNFDSSATNSLPLYWISIGNKRLLNLKCVAYLFYFCWINRTLSHFKLGFLINLSIPKINSECICSLLFRFYFQIACFQIVTLHNVLFLTSHHFCVQNVQSLFSIPCFLSFGFDLVLTKETRSSFMWFFGRMTVTLHQTVILQCTGMKTIVWSNTSKT